MMMFLYNAQQCLSEVLWVAVAAVFEIPPLYSSSAFVIMAGIGG